MWVPLGYSQGVCRAVCVLLEALGENPVPCPTQILEVVPIPWFMALFLHLQSQQCCVPVALLPQLHFPLTDHSWERVSAIKDSRDYIVLPQIT